MRAQGPDRRVLKAFYTQYVAVLLIILVFFVAAFQAASGATPTKTSDTLVIAPHEFFGDIVLSERIVTDGIASTDERSLRAIAEVLRSHDVNATIELTVPRMALDEVNNGAIRAAALTEHLAQFLKGYGAPAGAVSYVIRGRTAVRQVGGVVRIHWQERTRE